MRAEGSGWIIFQPGDDEDEAVILSLVNQSRWVQRTFTQPEAQKLYAALGDALGNMTPEPDEDAWQFTTERIDFAPIWSRADFEARARAEGWLVGEALPGNMTPEEKQ